VGNVRIKNRLSGDGYQIIRCRRLWRAFPMADREIGLSVGDTAQSQHAY